MKTCARSAFRVALMADHHLGYAVPIGGVVAYEEEISPSGVGFDIACGNKAVLLDADAREVHRLECAAYAPASLCRIAHAQNCACAACACAR